MMTPPRLQQRVGFSSIFSMLVLLSLAILGLGCASRGKAPPVIESLSPTPGPQSADSLRIATANLWGVVVLGFDWATNIDARFAAMADRLSENAPALDVVLIQEAWKDSARRALLNHEGVIRNFPFRIDSVERPGGAGLVILSRFPIEEAHFHRFQAQGNCFKFWEADCLSGKGVLVARLRIGDHKAWVANTHLIACYLDGDEAEAACDHEDPNGEVRMAQVLELRRFIEDLVKGAPALLGGDFNLTRTSRYHSAMTSPTHPGSSPGGLRRGWTESGAQSQEKDQIDYLWSRPGEAFRWRARTKARSIFIDPVSLAPSGDDDSRVEEKREVPLSDHPIMMTTFCLVRTNEIGDRCLSLSAP